MKTEFVVVKNSRGCRGW